MEIQLTEDIKSFLPAHFKAIERDKNLFSSSSRFGWSAIPLNFVKMTKCFVRSKKHIKIGSLNY